jgi:hypothetical protein
MFRATVAVAALSLLTPLTALTGTGAASAEPGDTVVVPGVSALGPLTTSAGVGIGSVDCADPGASHLGLPPVLVTTSVPDTPVGQAAWAMDLLSETGAFGPDQAYSRLGDFTSASLDVVNQNPTGTEGARVYAEARDGTTTWWGTADEVDLAAGTGWHTVSADAATSFTWWQYQNQTGDRVGDAPFTGTVAQLVAGGLTVDQGGVVGVGMGCGGGAFAFDAPSFGIGGDITTYDLETTGSSITLSNPTAGLVFAREPVPFHVLLSDSDGTPYQHGDVALQARPYGSPTWSTIGTAGVSYEDGGRHSGQVTVRPLVTAAYRWVYAGTDPSVSDPTKILVQPRLVLVSPRAVVHKGDPIRLRGYVLPAKPGVRVHLHRGRHLLRRPVIDANGRFHTTVKARSRGPWTLYLTIRRTPGNRTSVSSPVTVRVR